MSRSLQKSKQKFGIYSDEKIFDVAEDINAKECRKTIAEENICARFTIETIYNYTATYNIGTQLFEEIFH